MLKYNKLGNLKNFLFFRYCFPFGRPEGALKATLSLLERVRMKVKDRFHIYRNMNNIVMEYCG